MIRLAIVGFGKIAHDQHLPALARRTDVALAAIASPHAVHPGVPCFGSLSELLASGTAFEAVAVCTPPQARRAQAALALEAGKHVLLEKPPASSVSEIRPLAGLAEARGVTLFATWHSRHAAAVEAARAVLAGRRIRHAQIVWKEDVRVWHPGQDWIFEPGGLGVFDTGINALSIVTRVLPEPVFTTAARLEIPENRQAPIRAALDLADGHGLTISAAFDFLQPGPPTWTMRFDTDAGEVLLSQGGARLSVDGQVRQVPEQSEYDAVYDRFSELVGRGGSDVDLSPLQLVADAFLLGRRLTAPAFDP